MRNARGRGKDRTFVPAGQPRCLSTAPFVLGFQAIFTHGTWAGIVMAATTCSSGTTPAGSTGESRLTPWPKPARQRETLHSRAIYRFHPMFAGTDFIRYYGDDDASYLPATIEGADVHVLGRRAEMIGMGERSTPMAAELLASSLFRSGQASTVIAIDAQMRRPQIGAPFGTKDQSPWPAIQSALLLRDVRA